jgi:hypothetical protein
MYREDMDAEYGPSRFFDDGDADDVNMPEAEAAVV